jgi:phosphomannomutase/phosphoglucomutase
VLTSPLLEGERVVGHVLTEFPYQPVAAIIDGHRNNAGALDLVQGDVRSTPFALANLGAYRVGFDAEQKEIPGTRLRMAYSVIEPFVLFGPSAPLQSMILGLTALVAGVLLMAFRVQLERMINLRGSAGKTEPLTLKETLAQESTDPGKEAKERGRSRDERRDRDKQAAIGGDFEPATPPPAPVRPAPKRESKAPTAVSRSIFRAYDIRGVVGDTLSEDIAMLIGQAIGSEIRERGLGEVVVARDGRLSGPALSDALIQGLRLSGCDVIDIGAAPTPLLYFATYHLNTGSGVMVTGSHNPPDYNGFKIVIGGETIAEQGIQDLYARIAENRLLEDSPGGVQQIDVADAYIERITSDLQLELPLKVVVDAGNGIAGAIAPRLLEEIGCEVTPLHCEVDGTFPNHHPDPSVPANLQDLIIAVRQLGADIGVAFDGDGDRLGVVTPAGEIIYPDRLLMLFARDVLTRNPGATVIYDVKCTGKLAPDVLSHGGSPVMWKTGHSLIKRRMRELKAALAGEMSGHFFFQERWYGFDDGLYSACRLLEILASSGLDADDLFAEIPKGVSTPELKLEMVEGEHYRYIQRFVDKATLEGARLTTIDGLRADWEDGWGLVRASNTTPSLVLRFDADDEHALERIKGVFRTQMLKLDPSLKLPF